LSALTAASNHYDQVGPNQVSTKRTDHAEAILSPHCMNRFNFRSGEAFYFVLCL